MTALRKYYDFQPAEFTDHGNVAWVIEDFAKEHRFINDTEKWVKWNGVIWEDVKPKDIKAALRNKIKAHIQERLGQPCGEEYQKALEKLYKCIDNTNVISKTYDALCMVPGIAEPLASFDADPYKLNVKNGILDIRTGEFVEHKSGKTSKELCRLMANVAFDPDAKCPTWETFIAYNLPPVQQEYLQIVLGSSLAGKMPQERVWFLFGVPGTGKSKTLETFGKLLGSYAVHLSADTLSVKYGSSIPTQIARLPGKRYAYTAEVGTRMQFDEALLCDLAGGDTITARQLFKEEFDFKPQYKLFMRGNSLPQIKDVGSGLFRRLMFFEFNNLLDAAECLPKKDLDSVLVGEYSGILNWAVAGFQKWFGNSEVYDDPEEAKKPTEEYRKEADWLGQWLDDCCLLDAAGWSPSAELWKSFQEWSKDQNILHVKQMTFMSALTSKGFKKSQRGVKRTKVREGLWLKSPGVESDHSVNGYQSDD